MGSSTDISEEANASPNYGANAAANSPTLADFNPSGKKVVDDIKHLTDNIIAYIKDSVPDNRQRSLAITNYEQAAMWAVKANFV